MRGEKQIREYDQNSTVYRRLFLCRYLKVRGRAGLSRDRQNGRPRDDRYKNKKKGCLRNEVSSCENQ